MIYRIDVRATHHDGTDPLDLRQQIFDLGKKPIYVDSIQTSRIFLIDTDADLPAIHRIATELLADPIVETAEVFDGAKKPAEQSSRIEVHLKPGVMDPVAASTEMAVRDLKLNVREVRTGRSYVISPALPPNDLKEIATRVLANGVIESVHFESYLPKQFETGRENPFQIRRVKIRDLTEPQLVSLSRDGHLFLSIDEMKAIQDYFRTQEREPTDIELETLAQTWSEHCVHKTLKSAVDVEIRDEHGKPICSRRYRNLIKETLFASTMRLMKDRDPADPFCLSVFVDNAGVIAFDEEDAVCFKVETHNHPSAIEPYGGSATGAGGVIRDILGTGLAAKPVANTDIFCVAFPDTPGDSIPKGIIHPKRVLQQVVAGVRDYGNRMGIPTVNGAVYFDDGYLGNPLVFCGCVGLIPRNKIQKTAVAGDAIVLLGGRTGRDGIHGATFSSAELTDTHAEEFSHAVQIGNAITEKKVADVILAARDKNLFTAVTDCGAGGLSSAIGEMGEKIGATVEIEKVPLKYPGLRYDEIWISEAQERMVLSVPPDRVTELLSLARGEDVEATVIGAFGQPEKLLILKYAGQEVGRLSMHFLHTGIPMPTRKAIVVESPKPPARRLQSAGPLAPSEFKSKLLTTLAHPNIASKHWIIRQYDHEVQGGSVVKPLVGPLQIGPSDAAVLHPKLNSRRGVAIGCGLSPQIEDPYEMALAAIDEAIRNVVAVGADPDRIAILDNFCWPSVDDELTMGTLVRACEACADAALAYRIPFISGKDSLHNQFTDKETGKVLRIPRTLLISAIGIIEDVRNCITMDLKNPGDIVALIEPPSTATPADLARLHRSIAKLIRDGKIVACHDVSDGGIPVAAAEMCIASGLGLDAPFLGTKDLFAETPGRYLVEFAKHAFPDRTPREIDGAQSISFFATVQSHKFLKCADDYEISLDDLTRAWRGTLDW